MIVLLVSVRISRPQGSFCRLREQTVVEGGSIDTWLDLRWLSLEPRHRMRSAQMNVRTGITVGSERNAGTSHRSVAVVVVVDKVANDTK